MPLKWDDELAAIAQRLADQCFESNLLSALQECRNLGSSEFSNSTVLQNTIRVSSKRVWKTLISIQHMMKNFLEDDGSLAKISWEKGNSVGCAATSYRSNRDENIYMQHIICNYAHKEGKY